MSMHRALLPLALLVLAGAPGAVAAQVRHCVTPEGQHIFTDRDCASVGGVEQAQAKPVASAIPVRRGGCARNVDDLVFEMTGAFHARDANRLAGVYHWAGMAGSAAYDVMARLDDLVQKPLVDIVPVLPDEPEPVTGADPSIAAFEAPAEPAPRARAPVGLRVEQTQANGITPARTVFGLQRHFGCWWIKG